MQRPPLKRGRRGEGRQLAPGAAHAAHHGLAGSFAHDLPDEDDLGPVAVPFEAVERGALLLPEPGDPGRFGVQRVLLGPEHHAAGLDDHGGG